LGGEEDGRVAAVDAVGEALVEARSGIPPKRGGIPYEEW
jgi:hypothetical protein